MTLKIEPEQKIQTGPAVLDGFVRYTSVSALSTFDPTGYGGCPRRWWFKYVEKRPEPETKQQSGGKKSHKELEHYLKTGEDVLSPVTRAGKHLLPKPGKDLHIEENFGDVVKAIALREAGASAEQVAEIAGLTVAGIPMHGYIDVRHNRNEYVDEGGVLHKEDANTVETVDHKTTSDLKYAKSGVELVDTIQMIGYANIKQVKDLKAEFVRLSHISYQTRGTTNAKKSTVRISVEQAQRKWERVEGVGRSLIDVAKIKDAKEVEAQTKSCFSYNADCPHSKYCPATRTLGTPPKGDNMGFSFFGTPPATTPNGTTTPAPAPKLFGDDSARQTEIAAEKARLLAEEKPKLPAIEVTTAEEEILKRPLGRCPSCDMNLFVSNAAIKPGTNLAYHSLCPKNGSIDPFEIKDENALKILVAARAAIVAGFRAQGLDDRGMPIKTAISDINPPDRPAPNPVTAAQMLTPETIATIENEALRSRAAAHAASVAASVVPGEETKKKGARCSGGGVVTAITPKEAATKKKVCTACGKEVKIALSEDFTAATFAGHNLPKAEVEAEAVPANIPSAHAPKEIPAPVATQVEIVPVKLDPNSANTAMPVKPKLQIYGGETGVTLFVDVVALRGPQPLSLEDYYMPFVRELEQTYEAADIRCASNDTPLAFGKWKGALSALVRATPPQGGTYLARSSDEISAVVIDALFPIATVYRGIR